MYRSVLECAVSQIGQGNDRDGSNKYNEWYWGYRAKSAWCAVFMAWCFNEVGIIDRLNGLTNKAGCEPWRRWAVSKGIFSEKPRVGSVVLYDWNPATGDGADHIGIVESITSSGIIAIEGNTSESGSQSNGGKVLRKRRYSSDIMGYVYVDTNGKNPTPEPVCLFNRVAGYDRYNTSKATANTQGRFSSVVLASGTSFPDALTAAYLSRQKNAPIILTSTEVWRDTEKYIKGRPEINEIFIVGGENAVPQNLELAGFEVTRYAGANRYETNLAVLEAVETPSAQLLVTSGGNFPDGLCAGKIARPLMLTGKKLRLDQEEYIRERGFKAFYVIGGSVTAEVLESLRALGEVNIFSGSDRYETSRIVAEKFFPKSKGLIITTGRSFADGIAASNLGEYPLILADSSHTDPGRKYASGIEIKRAYVVGGSGAVSDDTANWVLTPLAKIIK